MLRVLGPSCSDNLMNSENSVAFVFLEVARKIGRSPGGISVL
jgi:hypothetical protein